MEQEQPLVSIVMLAWNRKEDLCESLRYIYRIDWQNLEVIVCDNHSTDGTDIMVETEFPLVKLLRMPKNMGIEAYNIGFCNAKGKYIVILDDDSFPGKFAIRKMVQRMEEDPKLGVVAFDVRNFYYQSEIDFESNDEGQPIPDTQYLMSFNGAGCAIRRDVMLKTGFYPEEFFLYMNELDWAFRIYQKGYRIRFFSDIVGFHKYSVVNRTSWRAPYYHVRNTFWILWKYYPENMVIKPTIRLMFMVFYQSFDQKTTVYLKAMLSAFWNMGLALQRRKPVNSFIAERLRIPLEMLFTYYK